MTITSYITNKSMEGYDIDTINMMNAERAIEARDEQKKRNEILAITSPVIKQRLWTAAFGTKTRSDDYLTGNVF